MSIQNYHLEYSLIGSFIRAGASATAKDVMTWLEPSMFENNQLANIYKAIKSQAQKDNVIDIVLLNSDYGQDFATLAEIAKNTASGANLKGYAEKIKTLWVNRQHVKIFHEVAQSLNSAVTEQQASEIANKGVMQLRNLMSIGTAIKPTHIAETLDGYFEVFEQRSKKDFSQRLLYTGLGGLDNLLGGINKNDLVLVAGRPAMGKTEFSLTLARNIINNNGAVLFFSLEMGNIQLVDRLISAGTGISVKSLREMKDIDDEMFNRIAAYTSSVYEKELFFVDRAGLSIDQIRTITENHLESNQLSAIVIDYLGLIRGGEGENKVQQVAHISSELKRMAKDFNVPVIALAQLNRGVESRPNKRPLSSDLRDSGGIEQDADRIIMLYREKAYNQNSNNTYSEAIVTKNRFGETGTAYMTFKNGHFHDCDQDEAIRFHSTPAETSRRGKVDF